MIRAGSTGAWSVELQALHVRDDVTEKPVGKARRKTLMHPRALWEQIIVNLRHYDSHRIRSSGSVRLAWLISIFTTMVTRPVVFSKLEHMPLDGPSSI